MTDRQTQNTSRDSTAIQAGRDIHYNAGISSSQMIEIMGMIQRNVEILTAQSKELMEERLRGLQDKIIKNFTQNGNGRPEAFSDPDFQGALLDAQKSIARSGGESLENVLVDLVSQKSHCTKRDRVSLTLNDAISKAGLLTTEDYDFLALVFLFKNVKFPAINDLQTLATRMKLSFSPFCESQSGGKLAIEHLESHGCIKPLIENRVTFKSGFQILTETYPSALTKGVDMAKLRNVFSPDSPFWEGSFFRKSHCGEDLIILQVGTSTTIDGIYEALGRPERPGKRYEDLVRRHPMEPKEFYRAAAPYFSKAQSVIEKYDSNGARNAKLTAVGVALAHARLSESNHFNAPLSTWIS